MAMYYYARKLQKGTKLPSTTSSNPSSTSSTSTGEGSSHVINQRMSSEEHEMVEYGHCCPLHPSHHQPTFSPGCHPPHFCHPSPSYHHHHQCCFHHHCCPGVTLTPTSWHHHHNGGLALSKSLHSLEQLGLSNSLPRHLPSCHSSLMQRSESQYENVVNGGGEDHFKVVHHVDQDHNKPQQRQRSTSSTSTLTEPHAEYFQETGIQGEADDDLDTEIQEIYYSSSNNRRTTSNSPSNYLQISGRGVEEEPKLESREEEEELMNPCACFNTSDQLLSGTWEALLDHILFSWMDRDGPPDEETLYAFLLSSRIHHPPHLTLELAFKRSSQTKNVGEEENGKDNEELNLKEDKIVFLLRFLGLWAQWLPYDFRDDRLMHFIRRLEEQQRNFPEMQQELSSIKTNLLARLTALQLFQSTLKRYKTESSIGEPIAAPSVVTICPSPSTMAEQLTLVELEYFSFLGAQELVAQLLRKVRGLKDLSSNGSVPSSRTGTKLLVRAATIDTFSAMRPCCEGAENTGIDVDASSDTQNLDSFISWFHRLAMYVASEICKMSKKKTRCKVIEYWIQVGKECLRIRNFNSLMAILAGLSCRPVSRLRKTWNKINCADLVELQTAMDPRNNFSAYRAMYKASVWKSLTIPEGESHNYKILVPYFALLLRDVYNLNSMYPSKIKSNGHINFEKYTAMGKLVKEIMSWQTTEVSRPFKKIPSIFNAVQAFPIYTEQEVSSASYGCEEPDGSAEKEHYNRLKRDHDHHRHKVNPLFSNANNPSSSSSSSGMQQSLI